MTTYLLAALYGGLAGVIACNILAIAMPPNR